MLALCECSNSARACVFRVSALRKPLADPESCRMYVARLSNCCCSVLVPKVTTEFFCEFPVAGTEAEACISKYPGRCQRTSCGVAVQHCSGCGWGAHGCGAHVSWPADGECAAE